MEVGTVCLSLEKYESLIQYKRDADKVFISHGGYESVDAKTKDEAIKYISKIADDSALKAEKTKKDCDAQIAAWDIRLRKLTDDINNTIPRPYQKRLLKAVWDV